MSPVRSLDSPTTGIKFMSITQMANDYGISYDTMHRIIYDIFPKRKKWTLLTPKEVKAIRKQLED